MQKTLLFKILIVCGLMAVLGIPLAMIQSTISERMAFRSEAVHSIASDSVREQTVLGPVLVIPYLDSYETDEEVSDNKVTKTKIVKHAINRRAYVFPNELQVKGNIDTDHRYRGIHKVLVYTGQYAASGDFILPKPDDLKREKPQSRITLGKPFIAISIDDVRGIKQISAIKLNDTPIEFEQGSGLNSYRSGLHAPLDQAMLRASTPIKFSFDLLLDGIERQHFVPVAKNNLVTVDSKWPHPQFGGRFLPSPKARRIDENGFSATWSISSLASNAQQQLIALEESSDATRPDSIDRFSVGFIEPINIYSQADRAVKYGLLFVALTFAAFFLFEILRKLPIHPVQYTLVGLAMALFFLLLVSLSEHLPFAYAYLTASSACIVLIGFYLTHVMRDWRRGWGFGAALTLLYGVLFGLLSSENNALVMGSILLFSVLAAIMVATRKVDWYQIGKSRDMDA